MGRTKRVNLSEAPKTRKLHRALSPDERENVLIAMAYDLAEEQLADGTVSSQVLSQLIRNGSSRGRAELQKLQRENELLRVKAESIEAAQRTDELYAQALSAMQAYSGMEQEDGTNL